MKTFEETLSDIAKKGRDDAVRECIDRVKNEDGSLPLIFERMSERPEVLISHLLYKSTVFHTSSLDPKSVELISVAVGSALNCRPCVEYHIKAAKMKGATRNEILETILIAGMLAQSSVLADAYRALDADEECVDGSCDISKR